MSFHSVTKVVSPPVTTIPTYDAAELAKGGNQALIVLEDKTYTLRITRAGKLILTK